MIELFYRLREGGIPVSIHSIMDFYRALKKGLIRDIDSLFLVTRLIFVKRVEHYDLFEQIFEAYFGGKDGIEELQEWEELFYSKPFRKWLDEEIRAGRLTPQEAQELPMEELIRRFWETVTAQREAHHGGNKWVGTEGGSPYGHSASYPQEGGIRVYGASVHGTARKVIGERRYINYAEDAPLTKENIRQILSTMKSLRPVGPLAELDIDETIYRTAKNGGEIELIFRRELRNKVEIIVLLDNGGYSMTPYIPLVKTLFHRIRDTFEHVRYYYFHNCIYGTVYKNPQRTEPLRWDDLLQYGPKARLIIIGDANMAPSELMASFGAIDMFTAVRKPGYQWLQELRKAFPVSVWLNPIRKELWQYESSTIRRIASIFYMEDLTLGGLKRAVEHLNIQGSTVDIL
ncbi:MAG: VWA domain-containing protein [Syntrophobacterales bacterium]|nr:VWA domain-containing protein [Syntrophobacterales bacterium]